MAVPIYEYKCSDCGREFEVFQKITDEPLQVCKHCSGVLCRLISHTNFHLKGTGWYATDYKDNRDKGKGSTEKKEDVKTEKKSEIQESC